MGTTGETAPLLVNWLPAGILARAGPAGAQAPLQSARNYPTWQKFGESAQKAKLSSPTVTKITSSP